MKYDKNRDDELVRSFSARKDDEPNSIGRSLIEPNINDSRATDRIDDDIIRISQHSIESDTADTNKGEQLVRNNNYSFKLSKNIIDQQALKLEEQHKKLHKYATELKTTQ